MSCKTIDIEEIQEPTYEVEYNIPLTYSFQYCVSYRDPSLSEWILARWIWNDQWIWTEDWVWED